MSSFLLLGLGESRGSYELDRSAAIWTVLVKPSVILT